MILEKDLEMAFWLENLSVTSASFQWDAGNLTKNKKHGIEREDVESLFLNPLVLAGRILKPVHSEKRWILLGRSKKGRNLALIFTVRDGLIRSISCRSMRKEELRLYEEIS